ncbi:MAG TPA: bifunctional nuclease domain-containing protein [Acidimicrobiales bacterium]
MSDDEIIADQAIPLDGPVDSEPSETAPEDVPYQLMHFESVLYDLTDPSPMVHLVEAASPYRFVVIPIALADGIALQHAHSEVESRRPGTHELMTTILTRLQGEVIAARIVRFEGGVYFAELDIMTPRGREVFDCRASDAMSMALRQSVPAPILCSENVLQAYLA